MLALWAEINGRLHWQRTVCAAVRVSQERIGQRGTPCTTFAGLGLDETISREIMTVLEPAGIEAAVLATEQETWQQEEILSVLKRELEAARYSARRAEKQYEAT